MAYDEAQLNGRIAADIRRLTFDLGWQVQEEATGVFVESNAKKPDILIRRESGLPMVVENEYDPGATLEAECLERLSFTVRSDDEHSGGKVSVVFGIRSPKEFKDCAHAEEAEAIIQRGAKFEYAVYQPKNSTWSRFPKSGFINGEIRDFVEFMRPASVPQDEVDRAADVLTEGANHAASVLLRHSGQLSFGVQIGEMLRQPWPKNTGIPNGGQEVKQYRADQEARLQTAKMCAVILINALAYQQNLSSCHDEIDDIHRVLERRNAAQLTKGIVLEEWRAILEVNYWPIFHIARRLLLEIPDNTARQILGPMVETADGIQSAMRQHDVAGIVFQRLIADRKTLKTYYTLPASTVLAANLAVDDDMDWGDASVVKNYRIADYACGTGGLIMAAYQRVRNLHRSNGGKPDSLHAHMMEHSLTACDIMPAAVHLSSSLLSSVAPKEMFRGTRNILYPFGGRKQRDNRGKVLTDADGKPVLERDAKGNPEVDIGSMELLDVNSIKRQVVLPLNERMTMGANGERKPIEVDMAPMSDDLVIMNPPFTRPTNHAPFNASDHVQPTNPAFAAFGTSDEEQRAMKAKERNLGRDTISDGNAGLGTTFTAIAHNMVKPGGRIALILPTSAMMGGSYDAEKEQAYSWQRLRNMLYDRYDQIIVVSIAQPAQKDSAFSADSDYADCIVTGRRATRATNRKQAHFVNLKARPRNALEAQEVARSVRAAIDQTTEVGQYCDIWIGGESAGFVSLDIIQADRKWTGIRIVEPTLVERARDLTSGKLSLPQRVGTVSIPMTSVREIAQIGPIARDITEGNRGPFNKRLGSTPGSEFPMLWNHAPLGKGREEHLQDSMLIEPDSHGVVKRGRHDQAVAMWSANAAHLHVNSLFRFNANATVAAWTNRKSLGGRCWPTLILDADDQAKALCVWLNSTLGMAIYWLDSNRSQDGRGQTSVTAIPNLPVLDVRALDSPRLAAAVAIFDDLKASPMLPANEAYRDPVRQEIDRRIFTEVLGLDDEAVEQLAILRNQWCAEPTVTGTKKTSILFNT